MNLAPGAPLEIGLLLNEGEPSAPIGRLAMAGGLAQLEWSAAVIEGRRRIDPLLYPPEPGLQAARGRDFDGLHGFLADSLPDAWGRLLVKRRLEKLGVRLETLTAVDRLALVGDGGRGALVYRPTTMPADDVGTMRDTFAHVIAHAGTGARTACLPKAPTLLAMRAAHVLKVSPLGPYHYRMIAADFVFDTSRIKAALGWRPTLTNREMLLSAYRYYAANRAEIAARRGVSAHRRSADMGVIRVLKWVS